MKIGKPKKEVAKYTHVEVISVWVINHLNEIDYIRMIQHFHNKNLKGKKQTQLFSDKTHA
jgi:hypothetical protein